MKLVCGAIALVLAIYNFAKNNRDVGVYWIAVTMYWVMNFIGG